MCIFVNCIFAFFLPIFCAPGIFSVTLVCYAVYVVFNRILLICLSQLDIIPVCLLVPVCVHTSGIFTVVELWKVVRTQVRTEPKT